MITKAAHELLCKKSSLIPTLAGALREQKLTDTQRDTLRGQYGLKPDSNLMLRNVGRGLVGSSIGDLAGLAASLPLLAKTRSLPALAGVSFLPLLGGLVGTHLATKKYSPANPLLKTDSLGGARQ